MIAWAATAVFQTALLTAGAQPYDQAYERTQTGQKPLMVLVGADWCPGCRTMKQSVLPRMEQTGRLTPVNYSVVNTDHQPNLAGRLMRGNSIPQLILFTPLPNGKWHREQITGAVSEAQVDAMISRGLAKQGPRPRAAELAKQN